MSPRNIQCIKSYQIKSNEAKSLIVEILTEKVSNKANNLLASTQNPFRKAPLTISQPRPCLYARHFTATASAAATMKAH